MAEEPQLQLAEIVQLTFRSLSCTVRCVAGTVRLGDTVDLIPASADPPIAKGLTVSSIEYGGNIAMDFIDLGRTALVTVTGRIDVAALRARVVDNASEHVAQADLRLVVR